MSTTHDYDGAEDNARFEALQALVAKIGLSDTLRLLADVCTENANKLEDEAQNEALVAAWEAAAIFIDRMVDMRDIVATRTTA